MIFSTGVEKMRNKKLQKTVVYVMLFAMITSTIMMGLSMFL